MPKNSSQDGGHHEQNRDPVFRILLVEDHEPSRTVLQTILAKRKFEVTGAATCREALQFAERNPFDFVICDIGLPDGNGFDLMAVLRERGLVGISVTGHGRSFDIEQSKLAGFSHHFTKPLHIGPMLDVIQKVAETKLGKQIVAD